MISNTTKERLDRGELAIGLGLRQARGADTALIAAACGWDWLMLDTEHNAMDADALAQVVGGALTAGVTPIVRVPGHERFHCGRALDAGALGVIVPHVNDAEGARWVVDSCRFPPRGLRSIPGGMPQIGFAEMALPEALDRVDEQVLVVVMLETPEAVDNAEEIAAVEGVDVLLIGTNDLAATLGVRGQLGHELIDDAYRRVAAAAAAAGKHAGIGGVYEMELVARYLAYGPRFVLGGGDLALLMGGARARAAELRTALATAEASAEATAEAAR